MSAKKTNEQQAVDDAIAEARMDFAFEHDNCMVCGPKWRRDSAFPYRLHVHEIVRGCHRHAGVKSRAAWLRLCGRCHMAMDDYAIWPIVRQLALKKLADPDHYDRVAVNELRGTAPDAITEREVDQWRSKLVDELPLGAWW